MILHVYSNATHVLSNFLPLPIVAYVVGHTGATVREDYGCGCEEPRHGLPISDSCNPNV